METVKDEDDEEMYMTDNNCSRDDTLDESKVENNSKLAETSSHGTEIATREFDKEPSIENETIPPPVNDIVPVNEKETSVNVNENLTPSIDENINVKSDEEEDDDVNDGGDLTNDIESKMPGTELERSSEETFNRLLDDTKTQNPPVSSEIPLEKMHLPIETDHQVDKIDSEEEKLKMSAKLDSYEFTEEEDDFPLKVRETNHDSMKDQNVSDEFESNSPSATPSSAQKSRNRGRSRSRGRGKGRNQKSSPQESPQKKGPRLVRRGRRRKTPRFTVDPEDHSDYEMERSTRSTRSRPLEGRYISDNEEESYEDDGPLQDGDEYQFTEDNENLDEGNPNKKAKFNNDASFKEDDPDNYEEENNSESQSNIESGKSQNKPSVITNWNNTVTITRNVTPKTEARVKKIKVKLNGPASLGDQVTGQIISNDRDVNENVGSIEETG